MDDSNKRVRDDSEDLELRPLLSKRGRVDSAEPLPEDSDDSVPLPSEPVPPQSDGSIPDAADSDGDSFEEAYIPDNLLDILDDAETVEQDLDSVIKSFEEEINAPPTTVSDSDDSQPDLGYLLEASDDELGLPPTAATPSAASELAPFDYSNATQILGYEDEVPSYESLGFGVDYGIVYTSTNDDGNDGGEFVMLDGLFDSSDFSEFLYRPESMPAW